MSQSTEPSRNLEYLSLQVLMPWHFGVDLLFFGSGSRWIPGSEKIHSEKRHLEIYKMLILHWSKAEVRNVTAESSTVAGQGIRICRLAPSIFQFQQKLEILPNASISSLIKRPAGHLKHSWPHGTVCWHFLGMGGMLNHIGSVGLYW